MDTLGHAGAKAARVMEYDGRILETTPVIFRLQDILRVCCNDEHPTLFRRAKGWGNVLNLRVHARTQESEL